MDAGVRKHDAFYENEDRSKDPKFMFKVVIDEINQLSGGDLLHKTTCDVGCASGDFLVALSELSNIQPENLYGIDVLDSLLTPAKSKIPTARFANANVNSPKFDLDEKFDFVCLMGVLQIFDDPTIALHNLLSIVKPNGALFVAGPFNKDPVTLITRYYNYSDNAGADKPEAELGWNIFCFDHMRRCVSDFSPNLDVQFSAIEFPSSLEIERREDDVLRSWTIEAAGQKKFINGHGILQSHHMMKVAGF